MCTLLLISLLQISLFDAYGKINDKTEQSPYTEYDLSCDNS